MPSPNMDIWLGIQFDKRYPDFILDGRFDETLEENGEIELEGLTFRNFTFADDTVGFGVELFASYGYVVEPFDLDEIHKKKEAMLSGVEKVLKDLGVEEQPGIFMQIHVS